MPEPITPDPAITAGREAFLRLMTTRFGVEQHGGDMTGWENEIGAVTAEILDPTAMAWRQRTRLAAFLFGITQAAWESMLHGLGEAGPYTHLAATPHDIDLIADDLAAYWASVALAVNSAPLIGDPST